MILLFGDFIKAAIVTSRFFLILNLSLVSLLIHEYSISIERLPCAGHCGLWKEEGGSTGMKKQLSKICNTCSLLVTNYKGLKARKEVKKIFSSGAVLSI